MEKVMKVKIKLTEEEIKNCVKFDDAIAIGNYEIDIHNPSGEGTELYYFKGGENYQIPYKSLCPKEFVNLVRYADYICTDSFHGSIFSVLHHKKFVVFDRYSKNSSVSTNTRIDSLLKNLDLEERRFKQNLFDELTAPIDYAMVEHRVQDMRSASMDYLRDSLIG